MHSWVLKSEPDSFGIDHLMAAKKQSTLWDGVRNYMARNNLRAMQVGDRGYFYHSSCKVPGIVGEMQVVATAIPDVTQFDPKSPYYDAKSTPEQPLWYAPQLKFVKKYKVELTRDILEAAGLGDSKIFKSFRLSVIPLTAKEAKIIEKLVASVGKNE